MVSPLQWRLRSPRLRRRSMQHKRTRTHHFSRGTAAGQRKAPTVLFMDPCRGAAQRGGPLSPPRALRQPQRPRGGLSHNRARVRPCAAGRTATQRRRYRTASQPSTAGTTAVNATTAATSRARPADTPRAPAPVARSSTARAPPPASTTMLSAASSTAGEQGRSADRPRRGGSVMRARYRAPGVHTGGSSPARPVG